MSLEKLIRMCRAYADMGSAVTEQLDAIVADDVLDQQNPNALEMIRDEFLKHVIRTTDDDDLKGECAEYVGMIDEYLKEE